MPDAPASRFLKLEDVAEELNMSKNQIYALVRQGELAAVKIGGRGQWRVERDKLEQYIERLYDETRQFIKDHPYDDAVVDVESGATVHQDQAADLLTPDASEAVATEC